MKTQSPSQLSSCAFATLVAASILTAALAKPALVREFTPGEVDKAVMHCAVRR
jgi:hypothetical protein